MAGLAAIVLGVRDLFNMHGPLSADILAGFAAGLTTAAVAAVYIEQFRHRREVVRIMRDNESASRAALEVHRRRSQVGLSLSLLHMAFHKLRNAAGLITDGAPEAAWHPLLVESLLYYMRAFTVVVGAPCRMSVKELIAHEDAPARADADHDLRFFSTRTLYRHDGSRNIVKDGLEPLYESSDFRQVWDENQTGRCFFSNDLDRERGYVNPHRPPNKPEVHEYNAAIVWPIQRQSDDRQGRIDLLGFLCVDTMERGVFSSDDVDLGAMYADTLYTVLKLRRSGHPGPPAHPAATRTERETP